MLKNAIETWSARCSGCRNNTRDPWMHWQASTSREATMTVKCVAGTGRGHQLALAGIMLAASAVATPAFAEGNRFMYSVGDNITYDDNLFRVPSGTDIASLGRPQRGDMINNSYIGMSVNKQLSRQSFSVDAQLSESRFSQYTYLNNSGESLSARWASEVGNHWKHDVSVTESKSLSSFVEIHNFQKNIVTSRSVTVNASYGILPDWSLLAGASASESTNSASSLYISDVNIRSVSTGIQYARPSGKQISLSLHSTEGSYPNQQMVFDLAGTPLGSVDNSYVQDDVSLNAAWQLTGTSSLNGYTSLTRRRHRAVAQRNYQGSTDSITYTWTPFAKYSASLGLRRLIDSAADVSASYVLTNGLTVSSSWSPTGKIAVQGSVDWTHRTPLGDASNVLAGTSVEQDHYRTAILSVSYAAAQRVQLTLKVQNQQRDSSVGGYSYTDNSITAGASFTF